MFKFLRERWKQAGEEAKGTLLKKDLRATFQQIMNYQPRIDKWAMMRFAKIYQGLTMDLGGVENLSSELKRSIADDMTKSAVEAFAEFRKSNGTDHMFLGEAYGVRLFAIYLEASMLPGSDAASVKETLKDFCSEALAFKKTN